MNNATLLRADDIETSEFDWGTLTIYASAELGNSDSMVVGQCAINPGCAIPKHSHPDCYETMMTLQGTVSHLIEDGQQVTLNPGDILTAPAGLVHQARNVGDDIAVLQITFSTGTRTSTPA